MAKRLLVWNVVEPLTFPGTCVFLLAVRLCKHLASRDPSRHAVCGRSLWSVLREQWSWVVTCILLTANTDCWSVERDWSLGMINDSSRVCATARDEVSQPERVNKIERTGARHTRPPTRVDSEIPTAVLVIRLDRQRFRVCWQGPRTRPNNPTDRSVVYCCCSTGWLLLERVVGKRPSRQGGP